MSETFAHEKVIIVVKAKCERDKVMKKELAAVVLMSSVLMCSCAQSEGTKAGETFKAEETTQETEETTEETFEDVDEDTEEVEVVETTIKATPTPKPTKKPTPTPTPVPETDNADMQYEDVRITDYITVSKADEDKAFYVPKFTGEGFEEANAKIDEFVSADENPVIIRYAVIDVSETEFTLIVYANYDYEWLNAIAFTVDTSEGRILSNDEILSRCGYESEEAFKNSAKESLGDIMTAREDVGFYGENYDIALNDENINKDMFMFMGHDHNIYAGSMVPSLGGASHYFEIYDMDGKCWSNGCNLNVSMIADHFTLKMRANTKNVHQKLILTDRADGQFVFNEVRDGALIELARVDVIGNTNNWDRLYIDKDESTYVVYSFNNEGELVTEEAERLYS